jgi:hypothetical protein
MTVSWGASLAGILNYDQNRVEDLHWNHQAPELVDPNHSLR